MLNTLYCTNILIYDHRHIHLKGKLRNTEKVHMCVCCKYYCIEEQGMILALSKFVLVANYVHLSARKLLKSNHFGEMVFG
jgi:hypothetical protein